MIVTVIIGLMVEITMDTFLDKWCLYDPWYLLFKNNSLYIILFFVILLLLSIIKIISGPAIIVKYKGTLTLSLYPLLFGAMIAFFYFSWFYGNYGAGACGNPKVNIDYYKYPGQDKYLE
jgi:hypothetical protein